MGIIQDGGPGLGEGVPNTDKPGSLALSQSSRGATDPVELFNAIENAVQVGQSCSGAKNSLVETACSRYARPAYVFCSSDLEDGLVAAAERQVAMTGSLPTEEVMRAQARQIMGVAEGVPTPADDPELMSKFHWHLLKKMPNARVPPKLQQLLPQQQAMNTNTAFLDAQYSEQELDSVFQNMDFEFGGDGMLKQGAEEHDGGVSLSLSTF